MVFLCLLQEPSHVFPPFLIKINIALTISGFGNMPDLTCQIRKLIHCLESYISVVEVVVFNATFNIIILKV